MNRNPAQKGSALVYILIAIALLAALTATFMDSSSQQTTSQNTFNTVTDLNSQINFIRSTIQECVLTYPSGSATLIGASNVPYPVNPNSTYFTGSTLGVAANSQAANVRCPGNPGVNNNHTVVFGGASGKFLPPAPKLFNPWIYYNGSNGVFFFNSTSVTDAYLATSLQKLDDQFSECEADIINTKGDVAASLLSSGSDVVCPADSLCFRVWLIAQPSANYVRDLDLDEAACP